MIEAEAQHKEDTPLNINIQHEKPRKKQSITKSTLLSAGVLVWADLIGVGPLATGYFMAKGGVWFTVATILLVATISDYTLNLMFVLVHKYKKSNYIDMCTYALGRKGRFFASLFVFAYNFSTLVANLLVIGCAVPDLLFKATGKEYIVFRRECVLGVTTALLLPIAFRKDIARFAVACSLTIFFFLSAAGILLYESIITSMANNFAGFQKHLTFVEPYCLQVLGGICYIFVCHDMAFSVAATLSKPTRRRWTTVVRVCISANILVSLSVGLFSYAIFVDGTEAFVPDNYTTYNNVVSFARLFVLLMIVSSIPYLCYLPRLSLHQLVLSVLGEEVLKDKQTALHIILTLLTPLAALLLAELVNDLGTVLSLSGGFSAAGLGFIMPSAVLLKLEAGYWYHTHKLPYVVMFLFGITCIAITVYSATTLIIYP